MKFLFTNVLLSYQLSILKKQKNIPKVFVGFLIVSFFIWLLINLSKEYTSTATYEIIYEQLAQDKILQEEPIKEVRLRLKANGFKLLSENFSDRKIKLQTNKLEKKSANDYYFLTNNQQTEIQKQLSKGLQLQRVLKDTIYLKLGSLQSKKVPVIANVDIQYQLGYNLAEAIKLSPDSIIISGPELQLSNVNNVKTSLLQLENLSKSLKQNVTILKPKNTDKIKMSSNVVEMQITVDKFTEGKLEIPIKVKNVPKSTKLNVFPKNVTVTYKVRLKHFNKVTVNSFKIVCDYKQAKENDLSYLIPKLQLKPDVASSIRINPKKIDFLTYQ